RVAVIGSILARRRRRAQPSCGRARRRTVRGDLQRDLGVDAARDRCDGAVGRGEDLHDPLTLGLARVRIAEAPERLHAAWPLVSPAWFRRDPWRGARREVQRGSSIASFTQGVTATPT